MKKSTSTALAVSLVLGLASTSQAAGVNTDSSNIDRINQATQQYRSMVSTDTALHYSEVLLERSTVARKLKASDDPADKARYAEAMGIYQEATKAHQEGNDIEAKNLALEAIRVIARAVKQFYTQATE